MKKFIVIGVILLILIIIIAVVIIIFKANTISPSNIIVKDISVTDDLITFSGDFMDAANNFKDYEIEYKDLILYLEIKGSIFSQSKSKGSINITIQNEYKSIKQIQLKGKETENNKIIWSR
jgi:hypothetical protein